MPFESSKAVMRRLFDRRYATNYFVGDGIDVGCGPDPISNYRSLFPLMGKVRNWDQQDGDGAKLEGIPDESVDWIHSSHSLEHMEDPAEAMFNWYRVLKQGGHMIILLPDEDMFEQGVWPSMYAGPDHKTSWTIYKYRSWAPKSRNVVEFFTAHGWSTNMEILKIEKLDNTYNYDLPRCDQTRGPIQECAIEIILRKRTEIEIEAGGRLPPGEFLTFRT